MKKTILLLILIASLGCKSQNVNYTVNENGSVTFEKVTVPYQPTYKYWRGELSQSEEEEITCIPYNITEPDYLGFIGVPESPQMGNGICFISRYKAGKYIGVLPFEKTDIYITQTYFKTALGKRINVLLSDNGDGTTGITFECASDGIINHLTFEIKVRQHYEE